MAKIFKPYMVAPINYRSGRNMLRPYRVVALIIGYGRNMLRPYRVVALIMNMGVTCYAPTFPPLYLYFLPYLFTSLPLYLLPPLTQILYIAKN